MDAAAHAYWPPERMLAATADTDWAQCQPTTEASGVKGVCAHEAIPPLPQHHGVLPLVGVLLA